MRKIFFLAFTIFTLSSAAQKSNVPPPPPPPDTSVQGAKSQTYDFFAIDIKPEFIGGDTAMIGFLQRNVTYPKLARENNIQGKVFVTFIIDQTGDVIDVELYKGVAVPEHIRQKYGEKEKKMKEFRAMVQELDAEALRVVRMMPRWIPGSQNGKNVKVRFILPISFKLA